MAAYAAVTSLYHTIDLLLSSSRTSIDDSSQKTLKYARWAAKRLQATLRNYDKIKNSSDEVLAVDARIRDEARKLEEAIESEASSQFLSQSQSLGRSFSLSLSHLSHDVSRFLHKMEVMGAEYMKELDRPPEAAVPLISTTISEPDGNVMVGYDELLDHVRDVITGAEADEEDFKFIAITGMAGVGKTMIVKKLFHDPVVMKTYKDRAFVRVGHKYDFEQILRDIMSQLNVKMTMGVWGKKLFELFGTSLRDRKYLIVLDDVWDIVSTRDYYNSKSLIELVSSRDACVLLTSRIDDIQYDYTDNYWMGFLDEAESWELLQRKVFGEDDYDSCPPQLVKAGKKIAENCEGLPLLIVSVANMLINAPNSKEEEYWEEVAKMRNSVFEDAMDQIHEVLLTSYHYLSQRPKGCFLYMCIFPKGYLVCRSKVNNLWLAEGFVDGGDFVLEEFKSSNLVVTREESWRRTRAKSFTIHIVNRYLSRRVAEDNKFVFVLNTYEAGGPNEERIRDKPHLAIHNNSLLAMKEVHGSIARVLTLRSMLCTGPYHQFQVPVCMELKLLRVLDAVTIRFYEFPVEMVKLIQLRYLSLSTNANLPPSIKKLWFLEYLIVHQHLSIDTINRRSSYVPAEIWEMDQLKYLELVGRNLPVPPPGGILTSLTTLLDVGPQSCARGVLESIPNLEKLRIRIEAAPADHDPIMPPLDHFCVERLKGLAGVVFNPKLLTRPTHRPRLEISALMTSLEKLSLSGFGYPWEDMSVIAELPNLQVLKLRCYAFRGEKWAASSEMRFEELRYLLIEDTDLVQWTGARESFPKLSHLTMRNCYRLHAFPLIQTLTDIQLVDCNPLVEPSARKIVDCDVSIECSWK